MAGKAEKKVAEKKAALTPAEAFQKHGYEFFGPYVSFHHPYVLIGKLFAVTYLPFLAQGLLS